MTSKDFVIWLDGYLKGNGNNILTTEQVKEILDKIKEVDLDYEVKKQIIIERTNPPINPFKIQEPIINPDDDFPGSPPKIYM
jgi:hypothetical protein